MHPDCRARPPACSAETRRGPALPRHRSNRHRGGRWQLVRCPWRTTVLWSHVQLKREKSGCVLHTTHRTASRRAAIVNHVRGPQGSDGASWAGGASRVHRSIERVFGIRPIGRQLTPRANTTSGRFAGPTRRGSPCQSCPPSLMSLKTSLAAFRLATSPL